MQHCTLEWRLLPYKSLAGDWGIGPPLQWSLWIFCVRRPSLPTKMQKFSALMEQHSTVHVQCNFVRWNYSFLPIVRILVVKPDFELMFFGAELRIQCDVQKRAFILISGKKFSSEVVTVTIYPQQSAALTTCEAVLKHKLHMQAATCCRPVHGRPQSIVQSFPNFFIGTNCWTHSLL